MDTNGECPAPLARVAYQRTGPGRRPATAVFDPRVVTDIRGWLQERRIWPLARCDVVAAEPTAAPLSGPPPMEERAAGSLAPHVRFDAPPSAPRATAASTDEARIASLPAVTPPGPELGLSREQFAELRGLSERLEAARPPRLWGDFTDPIRIEAWRTRCAQARAAEAEAEARARVDWVVRFAAEAAEALAEPDPGLEEERETRNAAAPPVVATLRWADADGPELTAWSGGSDLALAA